MPTATTTGRPDVTGPAVHRRVEQLMGMPISLALRGRAATGAAAEAAWQAVLAELREVDAVFSTYRDDSVVNRLDRGDLVLADCPESVAGPVAEVYALAERARRDSAGAFSIRLPGRDGRHRLDPSGVVKGWATDRAARHLDALADVDDLDYCLSAGGDLTCRVSDPNRPPWRIGIEDPHRTSRLVATVPVRHGAVATSGSARRGRHIVDARTGRPPVGVASVTVLADSLTTADLDATCAYAHGLSAAAWLRGRPEATGLVIWDDGTPTLIGQHHTPRPWRR